MLNKTLWCTIPFIGFGFGWWIDNQETERMTLFRDKSALYKRDRQPGEAPSWP